MNSSLLEAELAAVGLRSHLGLGEGWVDPFATLATLGVAVLRHPLPAGSFEGAYRREDGHAFAIINSRTDIRRQRFTAAHELAHHVLYTPDAPPSIVDVDLDAAGRGADESSVDAFAAAFLMSESGVRSATSEATDETAAIIAVMARFEVSKAAASRRCLELGLVGADDVTRLKRDRRSAAQLYATIGVDAPPSRRDFGLRQIDPCHQQRVRRLVAAGIVEDGHTLLALA